MIGKLPATHIAVQYYLKKPIKFKGKHVIVYVYRHFSSLQENSTCSERSSRKNEGLIPAEIKLLRTHSKAKHNIATTRYFHNISSAIGMNNKSSSSSSTSSLRRRLQYPEDIFTKYASITTGAANPKSESEGARTGTNSSSRSANTNSTISTGNGDRTGSCEVKAKGHPINDRRNKKGRRPKEGEMEGMKKNGMGEGSRSNKEGKGKGKGKYTYAQKGRRRPVNRNGHAKIKIMSDFASFVRDSQAARYKVHKPQCSCAKVKALHKNDRQITKSMDQDAFVILPEIRSIQSVFVGGSAPAESYSRDPIKCEKSLLDIIYPPKKISSSSHVGDDDSDIDSHHNRTQSNIKISFASCILDHEPNGFLCIASPLRAVVDDAKNRTLEARKINMKRGKIFHADHANYICTLHQTPLEKLVRPQSHSQNAQGGITDLDPSFKALLQSMQDQGVEAYAHTNNQDTSLECYNDNEKTNTDRNPIVTIKIGHHLKTMLRIMKGQNNFIYTIIAKSPTKNGGCTLEIDLPGGKRHIAETSFRCCVRETEEETSLLIDETWLITGNREPIKSKSKFENGNAFFLARPPGEEGLGGGGVEAVLADVFWKNTGLGGK